MIVKASEGKVLLNSSEVATAIDAYLVAHRISVTGPRTIILVTEAGERLCVPAIVKVDPSGRIVDNG